jgi:hypothetical protein
LGLIIPRTEGGFTTIVQSGQWTMNQGLNLFFVALIQVLSYPFHDPILTDRGFISTPKTTLKSYILATFIGAACIILFSSVGTFAAMNGLNAPATLEVSKLLGVLMLLAMNTIMITSAAATIDSTYSSTSKLVHLDLLQERDLSISKARWTMVTIAVLGTLPILFNPEILSATTISGTMVLGLAPVFVFWYIDAPKISYYLSVLTGIFFGLLMVFYPVPERFLLTDGKYADLLVVNLFGTIMCFLLFLIPVFFVKKNTIKSS